MINKSRPTVLVYRRTHTGDPDKNGVFGCNQCMGSVRSWDYDAVIGIGGVRPDPGHNDISRKINWIGIGPNRYPAHSNEPCVTFSKFILWDKEGKLLSDCAPKLDKYMFEDGRIPRTGKSFPDDIYEEILSLLDLAMSAPPSLGWQEDCRVNPNCTSGNNANSQSRGCR